MQRFREILALVLVMSLAGAPLYAAPSVQFGTVVSADRAHVGSASASTGTTVFAGDKISTEPSGSVQIRAGAARFLLSASSAATLAGETGTPSAALTSGTAVFSTANAKAFELHAGPAIFRPRSDEPTVAQVTVVSAKELLVKSTRGNLTITVDDETKIIPEGVAYRVLLDPDPATAEAQGPQGAGSKGSGGPPLRAGRSRFLIIAAILTATATGVALYEVLQSPDHP